MVESLKDLEKLLKLLRKQGVTEFKHAGIELRLGDLPRENEPLEEQENQEPAMLTDEQLIAWSLNEATQQ